LQFDRLADERIRDRPGEGRDHSGRFLLHAQSECPKRERAQEFNMARLEVRPREFRRFKDPMRVDERSAEQIPMRG
jgi:hypothetical protein